MELCISPSHLPHKNAQSLYMLGEGEPLLTHAPLPSISWIWGQYTQEGKLYADAIYAVKMCDFACALISPNKEQFQLS